MAGYAIPGPLCSTRSEPIDEGTLCRSRSPLVGPIGINVSEQPSSNRAFLFIIADEVLPSGKIIRKVTVASDAITSSAYVKNPEIFGFSPRAPQASVSIGEHALGNNQSPYISASTKAGGAPNFNGTPYYIDIEKAKAAGARIYSTEEIVLDLQRLAKEQPHLQLRVDKLIKVIKEVEHEVLVEGNVPPSAIKSPSSMNLTRGLRAVQFIGIVVSAYDLTKAGRESVQTHSMRPIAAEGLRQLGGWSGAFAGMRIGGMVGAAVGVETGPGAILTGAAGALIFGVAGYFSADWLAGWAQK